MQIDRVAVKQRAKEIIRTSKPSLLTAALIYTLLGIVISWLSLRLTGIDVQTVNQAMEYTTAGQTEQAMSLFARVAPSGGETAVDVLLRLALSVVGAGFVLFTLNTIRNTEPVLGNLLDGFGMIPRLLFLLVAEYVLIFLWSLLLFVPGLIAVYRYHFAVYILIDHPEYSAIQCLRESRRMTQGYKWQLFILDFSFLLWGLASALPLIGYAVQIWLTPYRETAKALYYERIRQYETLIF